MINELTKKNEFSVVFSSFVLKSFNENFQCARIYICIYIYIYVPSSFEQPSTSNCYLMDSTIFEALCRTIFTRCFRKSSVVLHNVFVFLLLFPAVSRLALISFLCVTNRPTKKSIFMEHRKLCPIFEHVYLPHNSHPYIDKLTHSQILNFLSVRFNHLFCCHLSV